MMMVDELKGAKRGKPPREVRRRNTTYLVTSHSPYQGIQGFRVEEGDGW
jgi:hypothetical protein